MATVCWRMKFHTHLNSCSLASFGYSLLNSMSARDCVAGSILFKGYRRGANIPCRSSEVSKRTDILVGTFGCPAEDASLFLAKNPPVVTMGLFKFSKVVKLFHQWNVSSDEIFTYPDVFKRNYNTISSRFQKLQDAGVRRIKLAHVNSTESSFRKRLALQQRENMAREVYQDVPSMLISCLGCSRQEASGLIDRKTILKDSKLSTLKTKLELLVAQGVTTGTILEKPWVLHCPVEQLEARSRLLRKHGITFRNSPKSFFNLLKCPQDDLERMVEGVKSELQVLGRCESKEEYLCQFLRCDLTAIHTLKRSYPKVLSVRATKLHATLSFLRECSISDADIIANGRVFSFSTDTLKRRYEELRELGCEEITARLLALDSRIYRKLVERLKDQIV